MGLGRSRSLLILASRYFGRISRQLDDRFYLLSAIIIALLFIMDISVTHYLSGIDSGTYDLLLKHRLSSPKPSSDIVIVDIDERSLERIGKDYGRWPWPRELLAEALANMADQGARSIFVNILFSEPDKKNPTGDDALQYVASQYPKIAFSFIRLPEENDKLSSVSAAQIRGAIKRSDVDYSNNNSNIAIIPPVFVEMQKRMGYVNLHPDEDGIIRNYKYWDQNATHWVPSAAAIASMKDNIFLVLPEDAAKHLNWRNKRGSYLRVSFADVYQTMQDGKPLASDFFKNKILIVGVSAPGVSTIKPTAINIAADDNEIIATAVDDVLQNSGLHKLPDIIPVLVGLSGILGLAWAFRREVATEKLDLAFGAGQASLLIVTYFSVSYSYVLIDMLLPFNVILAYFTVARTFYAVRQATWRGLERFWDRAKVENSDYLLIILANHNGSVSVSAMKNIHHLLRRYMDVDNIIYLDRIIEDKSFLAQPVGNILLTLAFVTDEIDDSIIQEIENLYLDIIKVDRYRVSRLTLDEVRLAIWRLILSDKMLAPTVR